MAQHLNTSTTNQTKNRITQHSDTPTEPTESSGSSTNSISPESRRNQELQQASRERENLSQSPLRYFADESPSRRYHRGLVPGSQSSWDFALSSQDHAPRPQAEEHARSSETSRNWIAPPGGFPRRPNSPQEGENLYYPSSVNGESDAEDDTGEGDALVSSQKIHRGEAERN
ncbi:hypothetical protein BDB00DRAFT_267319 [Zychaea mexicana]|uniref:uncharacterized protein n=1 Tax=Zychaea mexicana TaxID=64656 RepID=UPI0022FF1515|nr:uncharacterized protein BDB00DRAFT_267319 [Zychaea mexicana]KAI9495033.1 hypothetical protein BDB00DRAFT_267319 [Zychaea mexicana]